MQIALPNILLLNPNGNRVATHEMVNIAVTAARGRMRVRGHTNPDGPPVITTPAALHAAGDAVAAMRFVLMPDGVIVAAFGDPGADALRRRLPCPVVGIAEAAFLEAAGPGGRTRFAVATTTPDLVDVIAARVRAAGLERSFAGTFLTPSRAEALMGRLDGTVGELELACRAASAAGAEAVIIGGGPLARAARSLRGRVRSRLIEPIPAAVALLLARAGHG